MHLSFGQTNAVACRRPNGEIILKEEVVPAFFTRYRWAKWPFLRGSAVNSR